MAGEVISETHHSFWNPLRGHTGWLEEQQGRGETSQAVRKMITFQKLESSARKVFRGQLPNNPATTWSAWKERRRRRKRGVCILPKTSLLCLSSG